MDSVWTKTAQLPSFEPLRGNLKTDVPIIGGGMKYSRAEHTWDCPCHGSRFQEDGALTGNPATDNKHF